MSGCLVLMIDESGAMGSPLARTLNPTAAAAPVKSKADSVATAVNSLLNKLTGGPDFDVALVGYRIGAGGEPEIGVRWSGPLAGREFVRTSELAGAPVTIEQRTRKIPGPTGMMEDQPVDFPIWYQPVLGDGAPHVGAFTYVHQLLSSWSAGAVGGGASPLVLNIFSSSSGDGNSQKAVEGIQKMELPCGAPHVMHAHLSSSAVLPPTLYPSNRAYLPIGPTRDWFERASLIPDSFRESLKQFAVIANPKARGLVYNAKLVDLIRFLSLVQTHAKAWESAGEFGGVLPPPVPVPDPELLPEPSPVPVPGPTPMDHAAASEPVLANVSPEQPVLVLLVLDRSLEDPFAANTRNAFVRLLTRLGSLLEFIAKLDSGAVEVGIVSYGVDAVGETEVRSGLEGGFSGRSFAKANEIVSGAIRVDSGSDDMSDGVGGIISIPYHRPVLVEVEPTYASSAVPAFAEVARLVTGWCGDHAASASSPIVIHLTRGKLDAVDAGAALQHLDSVVVPSGARPAVYHVVETEGEHTSISFPENEMEMGDASLQMLCRFSAPLLKRTELALDKPTVSDQSLGFVVNAKPNLLLEAIRRALSN